ncbi:MAG: pilus assembly protein PilB, partial [Cyanobacteria bacterium J06659_2]
MSTKSEDLSPSAPNRSTDAAERVDLNQMFALIDGILPFEACLYYQVVPLSIQGSRLNLGMVDPNDRTAADYVRRLVSYINCSIVSLKISSDWHRDTLSQYLSHSMTKVL